MSTYGRGAPQKNMRVWYWPLNWTLWGPTLHGITVVDNLQKATQHPARTPNHQSIHRTLGGWDSGVSPGTCRHWSKNWEATALMP